VIFWPPFWSFLTILVPIRIYRKTGPTKSTVLGPGPPPWDFYKFYRILGFFWKNGPSIEPEKASVKSASTPYPPPKVKFMTFLLIRDPILVPIPFFKIFYVDQLGSDKFILNHLELFTLPFLVFRRYFYSEFFWLFEFFRDVQLGVWFVLFPKEFNDPLSVENIKHGRTGPPTGPVYRRRHRSRQ
jgi:hypothetical protein